MKNICFVCYNLSTMGGAETVAISVANSLCDYYNVHMVSLFGDEPFLPLRKEIKFTNLKIDMTRMRQGIIPATKKLKAFYKENNIEISFLIETFCSFVCSFTSLFVKTKQVFCDHNSIMGQWHKKDMVVLRWITSKLCSHTIALTDESTKAYIQKFHMNPKKVSCIYNWVDNINYGTVYNSNHKTIISVGRFVPEKQFHSTLLNVSCAIKQRHPDWQWHIYGDGELMEETSKKIKELNLENFLILRGKVNDLEHRYKDYSMCVMTSSREGMPLVLLEAKANGLPIVAFDVKTGPKEIVNDEKDGLLIPDMDVNKMADAICRLIENPDLREQMSKHALSTVGAFSKETILKQWIDFIESI